MDLRGARSRDDPEINFIPLIDVLLVILIFLMVTTTYQRFAELQIKAVLYQLVRRFRWSVPAGYTMPVQQAPISKPKDGLPVRFEPLS